MGEKSLPGRQAFAGSLLRRDKESGFLHSALLRDWKEIALQSVNGFFQLLLS